MPNTKADEYRNMPEDELTVRLSEQKQELFNLRFRNVTGQLDNPARLSIVRRDIARIKTILRDREIAAAEAAEAEAADAETEAPKEEEANG